MRHGKKRQSSALALACLLAGAAPFTAPAVSAWDPPGAAPRPEPGATLSVRPSLGLLTGEAREVVYSVGATGRRKTSDLVWDLSGVLMGGVTVSLELGPRLRLNAGAWTALTEGDGEMNDSDWLVEGVPWTDWSRSDVAVTEAVLLDLNASWLLWRNENGLTLRGLAGYRRDTWKWEDALKQFVYSLEGFRDFAGEASGINSIRYKQEFNVPYVGASLQRPLGRAHLGAYVRFSTWVSAEDRDFHVLRDLHFEESFSGGEYLGYGIAVTWPHSDRLSLSLALDAQRIPEIIGDMVIVEDDLFIPDSAGIEHESLTISTQATWRF